MATRILHCSDSIANYRLCVNERVAGFINRGANKGDLIYLVVKYKGKSYCGARFVLDEITDYKPWTDADSYVVALTTQNMEFCRPFEISILSTVGGKYWTLKYVQAAKVITDERAQKLLEEQFLLNLVSDPIFFESENTQSTTDTQSANEKDTIEDDTELNEVLKTVPDVKVSIMGTFQTVQFSNETDKIKGLETLVNENFYGLFPHFPITHTLLVPENRLFKTKGFKKDGMNVAGIRSLPDGLLLEFNKKGKTPFRINLIEYECYGEKKQKENEKSSYLNSIIIPQLMRFASAFSIITDEQTRTKTINDWVDKIIAYINSDEEYTAKVTQWIKEINPAIKERSIEREMEKLFIETFKSNLRVILVIDELSSEQKLTIKNVVSSFKLSNGESNVQFTGYVVRLVQKINIVDHSSEYALTIQ